MLCGESQCERSVEGTCSGFNSEMFYLFVEAVGAVQFPDSPSVLPDVLVADQAQLVVTVL